jgi:uncharacterized protein (TIGR00251 family)
VPDPSLNIRETAGGIEVPLHVQPRARRSGIAGLHGGALKLKLTAPPVDQAANRALVDYFASLFEMPRSCFRLASGEKSRNKVLAITGISARAFLDRISGALPR